jgi:lipoyl-dependent peroxiredoxin
LFEERVMKIKRTGSATWSGGLKDGRGAISTESGALKEQPYGFAMRFEGVRGTNPEELIGAAHAGCFTMALSLTLEQAGFKATRMDTTAAVTLEQVAGGFSITAVALTLSAQIPGIDEARFQELASSAKANCPVSKLMKAEISLDAKLA